LHQHQRVIRTAPSRAGAAPVRYVEVELTDIALANELAHEVLGRTLDELPPQTRRLLGLIVGMVERECAAQHLRRGDYRFSRRAVREHTKWGDTQLKIHLARLVELEYLLVHRGGRGQSFEYELVFDGAATSDVRHLSGLIDIEALHGYDGERSALEASRSGSGRPAVGERSVGERVAQSASLPEESSLLRAVHANGAENAYPR